MDRRTLLRSAAMLGGLTSVHRLRPPRLGTSDCDWRAGLGKDLKPLSPIPRHFFARGRRGLVSTDHPLATMAAACALEKGGTAADAYVAAASSP